MILSGEMIAGINTASGVMVPPANVFTLPERVLQFGTGVLLRGLPDYFIDKANRAGIFNGRVVVVKSTDKGGTEEFSSQDGMYTLCIRGIRNGRKIDEMIVNAGISRVLSASSNWQDVLSCASNPNLQVIISNTTESGIKPVKENILSLAPPSSFPGKLLAFLYERYKIFDRSPDCGMVILPTELVPENGSLLRNICIQLAAFNNLDDRFMTWLMNANDFCNTLVDRIVPGALPEEDRISMEKKLGYQDKLMIMAEPYCLWAIETSSERTRKILSFSVADSNLIIKEDINKYREIKLHLLNAPHTFSCALALYFGFPIVRSSMEYHPFRSYVSRLISDEIIPALVSDDIHEEEARRFASDVIDRFSNPFIHHEWLNISVQYTLKMRMRCIPLLMNHYSRRNSVPRSMALGFAAYLLFMRSGKDNENRYTGKLHGKEYVIQDEKAPVLYDHWKQEDLSGVVSSVLKDESLWGTDLTRLPDFEIQVLRSVELLRSNSDGKLLDKQLISL